MSDGEYRTCRQCGSTFWADETWKRICFDCWKINKQRSGEWRGSSQQQPPRNDVPMIPEEQLRRLLHLCHPDKHGNSPAATAATQWLLEISLASRNRH